MKKYKEIQEQIDKDFKVYISDFFIIKGEARKYYYWTVDFFQTVGGIIFQHYNLSLNQKNSINNLGNDYFDSDEVQFYINKQSHRNDITIRFFFKLFLGENISQPKTMYEYIKEYILWDLLKNLKTQIIESTEESTEELKNITKIIKKQKANFLITYITYLCNEHSKPFHPFFSEDYINYLLTNQGEELSKKLDENSGYDNTELKDKLEKLFVQRKEESKIHFVFSRVGGGEKEELRELLEIMGKRETGNLYRGQANSSWNLDSSITREQKYLNNEAEMYYEILSLKPDAFQNDRTVYERLITMQHYGMPTRLLDITRNPLIAIFFACNNLECKEYDGIIHTFAPPKEKSDFLNFENKKLDYFEILFNPNYEVTKENEENDFLAEIWFIKGVAKNLRINNQSGDFIFVGKGAEVKNNLHKLPKMTIMIDSHTKKVLLEQLESLNIHGGAVYPDLTHISNYILKKYSNGDSENIESDIIDNKRLGKETTAPEIRSNKIKKEKVTIIAFDFNSIKNKNRKLQLKAFAKFYNLKVMGLTKLIDDFLFTKKNPFRDEVAKIMNENTSILKNKVKIDLITDKIITLAKMVGEE